MMRAGSLTKNWKPESVLPGQRAHVLARCSFLNIELISTQFRTSA